MSSDTCPWCGAAADIFRSPGRNWFSCGTPEDSTELGDARGVKCFRNEVYSHRQRADDAERRLVEVTAERDSVSTQLHDELVLTARLKCDFVNMKNELAALKATIAAAPVWYMENGGFVSAYAASFRSDKHSLSRVRLLPEPEVSDGVD